MPVKRRNNPLVFCFVAVLMVFQSAHADEVQIVSADFQQAGNGSWSVDIGLLHSDSGWDHYADIWRILDEHGAILGERVLLHPHVNEQPFVRGTSGVEIPEDTTVYVVARDSVHGWSSNPLEVDLSEAENGRLVISGSD